MATNPNNIQLGDAVVLNGNSHVMTVDEIDGSLYCKCVWHFQGVHHEQWYYAHSLRKANV